jgi:hypothetical protein
LLLFSTELKPLESIRDMPWLGESLLIRAVAGEAEEEENMEEVGAVVVALVDGDEDEDEGDENLPLY